MKCGLKFIVVSIFFAVFTFSNVHASERDLAFRNFCKYNNSGLYDVAKFTVFKVMNNNYFTG